MTDARRVGIVSLLVLLAGGLLLAALPHGLAAIRLGGVGLLWWYGALAAPLLGTVLTIGLLLRPRA